MEKIETCPHCGGDISSMVKEIAEFFASEATKLIEGSELKDPRGKWCFLEIG
jgi:hypothetical protein